MVKMKKMMALLLAVLMMTSVLAACGGNGDSGNSNANSTQADYTVTVVDALGVPYSSGVVVKFMKDGVQAAMQIPDEEGKAVKTLDKGDYTVELQYTDSEKLYVCNTQDMTLSAEKTELQVELVYGLGEQTRTLGVGDSIYDAAYVGVGCTNVTLSSSGRTYFMFVPTQAGLYEFSVAGSDAPIGYYGAAHFVQENPAVEVVDNKFTLSIREGSINTDGGSTFEMVLGLDAAEGDTVLCIQRLGDPEWTLEDEPWTVYSATVTIEPYTLPAGSTLKSFDITASTDTYNLVLDDNGYYHLDSADGPLVLMRLGQTEEPLQYLDCFETILEHSGVTKYFFDAEGNFEKKESYSECLLEYIACVDKESGTYPLTEDLKYILQQRGEYSGWFDPENSLYLFVDGNGIPLDGINNEISWLFMCSYIA